VSLALSVGELLFVGSGMLVVLGVLLRDLMALIRLIRVDLSLLLVNCVILLLVDLCLAMKLWLLVCGIWIGGFHLLLVPHVRIKLGLVVISLRERGVKVALSMGILRLFLILFHFSELICNFKL
jgi:hypothetical protein